MDEKTEKFLSALDSIGDAVNHSLTELAKESETFWQSLTYDQKIMVFHAVCKRIHQGECLDKGTYRHVLYNVFEFGSDAYTVGMACGYFDIHNAIFAGGEHDFDSEEIKSQERILDKINTKYHDALAKLAESEKADNEAAAKKEPAYTEPANYTRKIQSRYGDPRWITDLGNDLFTIEGPTPWARRGGSEDSDGLDYYDPSGGPFIAVGDVWQTLNNKEIVRITEENSSFPNYFKVLVKVKNAEKAPF